MLENRIIATLDGETIEFETNFGRKESRRISFDAYMGQTADNRAVELAISVSHYDAGRYLARVDRHTISDGIVRWRAVADTLSTVLVVEGSRYSAKKMEAIAEDAITRFTESEAELRAMVMWARELTA